MTGKALSVRIRRKFFEQVYCHSKQSLLEILLSDKTLLEGTSRAFLENKCHHSSCRDVYYQTYIRLKQKDWRPCNAQGFNKGILSTMPFPAIHSENGILVCPLDSVAGFCLTFFGTRSTMSVLIDPRQTSVCGGLLGTKPTQRQISLDVLRLRLLLNMHPNSHPSLHKFHGLVSGLVNSI